MEKFINDLGAFLEQPKIVTPYKREIVRAEPVAMPATIISQDRINLAMRR